MSFGASLGLMTEATKGGPTLVAPDHPPKMIHLVVGGAIDSADTPALCDRVRAELSHVHPDVVVLDVGALGEPDLGAIDALARARLAALRIGCELRLSDASAELRDLLHLAGLAEAVPCEERSGLESDRKPEGREEARGVEKERDAADLVP